MINNDNHIVVSICCLTFRHYSFIKQCLDGLLMQKTNFKFEILIHDDASTDGTEEIIREYADKYPEIIKPLYETQNQWNLGRAGNAVFNYPRAKGKYMALCEGDDYWTDPNKLQKQVDFLEANLDYSMCFHNANEVWTDESQRNGLFAKLENREYSVREIYNRWLVPTASAVFKKEVIDSNLYQNHIAFNPKIYFGDIALFISCAQLGRVWGFPDVMSVYTRHSAGVTSQIACMNVQYIYCNQGFEMATIFSENTELAQLMIKKSIKRTLQMYWTTLILRDSEYRSKCIKLLKLNSKNHKLLILGQLPVRLYMALRTLYKNKKHK